MTYLRRMAFAAAAVTLTVVSMSSACALELDLATVWPDSNFHTQDARKFAEAVAKETDQRVTITVHSGGALGFKGPELLTAVSQGLVPMADMLDSQQVGNEPLLGAESIPFLVQSADELKVLHKYLRPAFDKIARKYNQKILYMVPWPTQYIYMGKSTTTLDGFANLKIRVSDKNAQDMGNAIGMAAILMPWGEVVPALASGRIEAVATSAASGVDGKFWEFLKTIYPTNHAWSSQMVTINLDSWAKISPADQAKIEDVAKKLEPEFWDVSLASDKTGLKTLLDHGMKIVDASKEMRSQMIEKTLPLREAFFKRVPDSRPIVEDYLKEVGH